MNNGMNRQDVFAWAKETFGTEPDYPWDDWNCVFRHKHNHKWYAVILEVNENKLGLSGDRVIDVLNVKCDSMLIGSLRQKRGFFPAYHMNKDKWISVALDGTVPSEEIKSLIELSYELTNYGKGGRNEKGI